MRLLIWMLHRINRGPITSRRSWSSGSTPAVSTKVTEGGGYAKDVIIYKNDNPRFFRALNMFGFSQMGFWGFIAYTTMSLKDTPVSEEESQDLPFYRRINLGDTSIRNSLVTSYILLGYAILAATTFYTMRSIRYLILRKDGKHVAFVTYTPTGQNRIMNVPLSHVSASGSRAAGKSYIPLKLKNRRFFYLLDTRGEIKQTALFDRTVGLHRKL